jgi:branched-chain amino acid transport system ATP-binding protein
MLKIKDLSAFYDKAQILYDLNLKVGESEAVAVLGPNGAGKSTLLNSICGIVNVKGGIELDGQNLLKLKPHDRIRSGISICPEGRRLFLNMSVEDNLILGATSKKHQTSKKSLEKNIEYIFSLFPRLKERRTQTVKTMSGGEQQMVAIGRALMSKPKLLMLDEPSIGLAPIVINGIADAIKRIKEELNVSILLVEQNIHLALDVADRIYILVKGKVVKEGTVEELHDLEEKYLEV